MREPRKATPVVLDVEEPEPTNSTADSGDDGPSQVSLEVPEISRVNPIQGSPVVGDAGRQFEVIPVHSDLCVGVADTAVDFVSIPPYEIRACSTRGYSHRFTGAPRQDAYAIASNEEWLVVAVADGVSEAKHSDVAALVAARAACKLSLDLLATTGRIDWGTVCGRLSRRIMDEARYRRLVDLDGIDDVTAQASTVRRTMATTLIVAGLPRLSSSPQSATAWVASLAGDCSSFSLRDGRLTVSPTQPSPTTHDASEPTLSSSPITPELSWPTGGSSSSSTPMRSTTQQGFLDPGGDFPRSA